MSPNAARKFRVVATDACNLACRQCFNEGYPTRENRMLQAAMATKAILTSGYTPRSIKLTGGDPLLHPDIGFLATTLEKLAPVSLTTNGLLLSRRLPQIPPTVEVTVSVYGTNAREFEHYAQRPARLFDSFLDQVGLLVASKHKALANILVRPDQQWSADGYFEFCQRLGFRTIRFISLRGDAKFQPQYRKNALGVTTLLGHGKPLQEPEASMQGVLIDDTHLQVITQYEDLPPSVRPPGFVWIGAGGEVYETPDPQPLLTLGFTKKLAERQ
jgi:molybdenum cofactor biosynthesis enzyme MoaA